MLIIVFYHWYAELTLHDNFQSIDQKIVKVLRKKFVNSLVNVKWGLAFMKWPNINIVYDK